MRLPFSKVYRAFPELDGLSDEECERYVRFVKLNRQRLVGTSPLIATAVLMLLWIGGWTSVWWLVPGWLAKNVPLATSPEALVLLLAVSTVFVPALFGLLLRDLAMWIGLRDEVIRARCPKCKQSMVGVPVQEVGLGGDPAKRFVRCPECGRKYMLLDIGITPRDLIPFEQRAVPEGFARLK